MNFLEKNYPDMSKKYQRLYPGAYAPKSYAREVQGIVKILQAKYEVRRRPMSEDDPKVPLTTEDSEEEQRDLFNAEARRRRE
jgi:hypothetical protein